MINFGRYVTLRTLALALLSTVLLGCWGELFPSRFSREELVGEYELFISGCNNPDLVNDRLVLHDDGRATHTVKFKDGSIKEFEDGAWSLYEDGHYLFLGPYADFTGTRSEHFGDSGGGSFILEGGPIILLNPDLNCFYRKK